MAVLCCTHIISKISPLQATLVVVCVCMYMHGVSVGVCVLLLARLVCELLVCFLVGELVCFDCVLIIWSLLWLFLLQFGKTAHERIHYYYWWWSGWCVSAENSWCLMPFNFKVGGGGVFLSLFLFVSFVSIQFVPSCCKDHTVFLNKECRLCSHQLPSFFKRFSWTKLRYIFVVVENKSRVSLVWFVGIWCSNWV